MKSKMMILTILLLTAGLLVAGCGGGQTKTGEFEITVGDDFAFTPSTIKTNVGQEITITFINDASVEHTFNILQHDTSLEQLVGEESQPESDEHDDADSSSDEHDDGDDHSEEVEHIEDELHLNTFFEMHAVAAGESTTDTFNAPSEPGEYIIFCSIPGHADAGMVGTLTIGS